MSEKSTLTKIEIANDIKNKVGITQSDSKMIVDDILDFMKKTIAEKDTFHIRNFGTFKKHKKERRMGRNPKTMEEVEIKERNVVLFEISKTFKKKLIARKEN